MSILLEVFKNNPFLFIVTVVIPIISGLGVGVGGFFSLSQKIEENKNSSKIISEIVSTRETIQTLNLYEKLLLEHEQKDKVLNDVLSQYQKIEQASEDFAERIGSDNKEDSNKAAKEILDLISNNLYKVKVDKDLPNNPLIISLSKNRYKIIFSVPMRIPPNIIFTNLPTGSTSNIIEKSKYGFTVQFMPVEVAIDNFGFIADAEL